ncbi:hypothetical protein ABW19_dt0200536 [Dactylella cylindrospora]|nr:hypothetical protein ABW19_dt0200536 [Dactylella cylindrospora]
MSRLIAREGYGETDIHGEDPVPVSVPQVVYYQSGVGTGNLSWVDKRVQGAFGSSLDENVCTAYNFLCNNYAAGDEIFLFGFSRGAYTARALSGLVLGAGLLPPGSMIRFSDMYKEYKKRKKGDDFQKSKWWEEHKDELGITHAHVSIKFIGVWDTVGALGIPDSMLSRATDWNKSYQFYDTELHPRIEKAAHALALDEYRGTFSPTLWYHKDGSRGWNSNLIQCWFPGFHGHIGGGTVTGNSANDDETSVDDLALAWMVDQVADRLTFDTDEIERFFHSYKGCGYEWAEGNLQDSGSYAYLAPGAGGWVTRKPGRYNHIKAKSEKIDKESQSLEYWGTNEFIHPCVRYRMGLMNQKPKDLGYVKGWTGNAPVKAYDPSALKEFERPTLEAKEDNYWYWKIPEQVEGEGHVIIREYQIPPMWAENYKCFNLERRLVPPDVMRELDEGNNYGEDGPLR